MIQWLIGLIVFVGCGIHLQSAQFVVIIPSYNNAQWYHKNLTSVFTQTYENFRVIYIDDASSDGTGDQVEQYLVEHGLMEKTTLIKNSERKGALANYYHAIHSCQDDEIVVTVDGDDWLAHEKVLERLAEVYSDSEVWMTYGQFQNSHDGSVGFCSKYSKQVIKKNQFREIIWKASHLRTFYAGFFKKITKEDLLYQNQFVSVAWDIFFMIPMLEMAGKHHYFFNEVLYVYNTQNQLSDVRQHEFEQIYLDLYARNKKKYEPLEELFNTDKRETISLVYFTQRAKEKVLETIQFFKDYTEVRWHTALIITPFVDAKGSTRSFFEPFQEIVHLPRGIHFNQRYLKNGWFGFPEFFEQLIALKGDYVLVVRDSFFSVLFKGEKLMDNFLEGQNVKKYYLGGEACDPVNCVAFWSKRIFFQDVIKHSYYAFQNFYALKVLFSGFT